MTAYLGLYEDYHGQVARPEDHEHEVGEPEEARERCANCRISRAIQRFTPWEAAIFAWYYGHVNAFSLDSGLIPALFRDLALEGAELELALMAMNKIHVTNQRIHERNVEDEIQRRRGTSG